MVPCTPYLLPQILQNSQENPEIIFKTILFAYLNVWEIHVLNLLEIMGPHAFENDVVLFKKCFLTGQTQLEFSSVLSKNGRAA